MKLKRLYILAGLAAILFFSSEAAAQSTFTLTNSVSGDPVVFTNSVGTVSTNGTLIVFEGTLESQISVPKALSSDNSLLASVQLLTQVRLFDDLPAAEDVGSVQGAVAALRDGVGSSTGTYYVWAVTNTGLGATGWTQLLTTNQPPGTFSVTDGETNYVTFVFSYPPAIASVMYQVFIGNATSPLLTPSAQVASPTVVETNGINSVSMLGMGGVMEVGSVSGATGPLSSSVDFSVYATPGGVRIEINTVDEEKEGVITVYALINGAWAPVGTVQAKGYGSNTYYLNASGLEAGQSYWFKVVDEAGHTHTSTSAIEVKEIKMAAVSMLLDAMCVTFNTEYGRKYQVKVSEDLSLPIDQWSTEQVSVYNPAAGTWSAYSGAAFMAGPGKQTSVKIPKSQNRAFFKVIMVDPL